jgi:endonuclease/exonuclease/phosphatase family metal-dependent hydrolase
MTDVRIASYNVENLFARPRAFDPTDWAAGRPAVEAHAEFNALIANAVYSNADKVRMRELLLILDIYTLNEHGAIRRKQTSSPRWAWLRKNRGGFDRQPEDPTQGMEIIAAGREDWIGWVELAVEATDEVATRLTARVIADVNAHIIGVVEVEDRPSLVHFNRNLVGLYRNVMVVDGNDDRGIDVGLMTKTGFDILDIRSHVYDEDDTGFVFSRDCADYEIQIPGGATVHVLVNHFKSQSGGGGAKRARQAARLRQIVDELVAAGERAVVVGDLNEGQTDEHTPAENFAPLFDPQGPLVACYDLPGFNTGPRLGTFDSCDIEDRLDYIFVSRDLAPVVTGGGLVRDGLWGSRKTRPTAWKTYEEMTNGNQQASDHAAVFIDLAL